MYIYYYIFSSMFICYKLTQANDCYFLFAVCDKYCGKTSIFNCPYTLRCKSSKVLLSTNPTVAFILSADTLAEAERDRLGAVEAEEEEEIELKNNAAPEGLRE